MNTPFKGIEKQKNIYFIGIGGIGMSALAKFFKEGGAKVSGYDKTRTELTKQLEQAGISVRYVEDVQSLPKDVDLVVYTPAVPAEHLELNWYRENGYKVIKRSDVLQLVTGSSFNICIAGTHGKTTITTLTAHLLRDSGFGCNAFLGGIAVNYNSNFWSSDKNVCVVEADEYDRSFLKLNPGIAVITAMDADHLDIYGTSQAMEQAFVDFSNRLQEGGLLISRYGLQKADDLARLNNVRHLTYSVADKKADVFAENIGKEKGSYVFDVQMPGSRIEKIRLNMGGMHNIENAIAAITIASSLNIDKERIRDAVENFRGVKRRFEFIVKNDDYIFIDDYAHHPEELRALINGARDLFEDKRCTVIFQPHLYTRTRDLANGFADVLELADEVILLPIYPAREFPLEGVSSELILEKMKGGAKRVLDRDGLLNWVRTNRSVLKRQVLITAGAGDIDLLVEPIKEILIN